MSEETNIRDIVIAGGTVAGWFAAAVLARTLPAGRYTIRLVEPAETAPDLETSAAGLAALPALRAAHGLLGLSEEALAGHADAGFSLGAEFAGWPKPGKRYFRPFAPFGASLDGVAFHNLWLRMRRAGGAGELEEYSLGALAAKLGRFAFPSADPGSILSTLDYGYHLDGAAYRRVLRAAAEQRGVTRIEGAIGGVERGADGGIAALVLASGERLEADMFFDCTGAEATLLGALGVPFESWSHWLPSDRLVASRGEGEAKPCLRIDAGEAGWRWHMPLRTGAGIGDVRASAFAKDAPEGDEIAFASGRRAVFWSHNCVALGAAACVIDPIVPAALQAVQRGISQFLTLMPFRDTDAGGADEYNRVMIETVERMRDLAILHYHTNARDGAFWAACREMAVPDVLARKTELFAAKAKVLALDEEMFPDSDWVAAWLGQGVEPRAYDALADQPDKAVVRDRLAAMRKAMRAAAEAMPRYEAAR